MSFLESIRENDKEHKAWLSKSALVLFIIGSILMPLVYFPFVQNFISTPKLFLIFGVGLIILFLFLLDVLTSKEFVIRQTFLGIPLFIFLVLVAISTGFSLIPAVSFLGKASTFVMSFMAFGGFVLWFWLLIQLITTTRDWQHLINGLLISTSIAGLLFLLKDISIVSYILPADLSNPISNSNTLFGIYMAVMGTFSLGMLQIKEREFNLQLLPGLTGLISIITLFRLGFQTPLIILAVGLALLLMVGTVMLQTSNTKVISATFGLFIITVLGVFIGVPGNITAELPSEVSINASTSWSIVSDTVTEDIKSFIIGSGPGTFIQDFSMHRPEALNMNSLAWDTRFEKPFNTFFAIASEMGMLGLVIFGSLIFIAAGGIFSGWLKTKPSLWQKTKEKLEHRDLDIGSIRLEVFVIIISWIALTVGMFFAYYGVVLWWLWFTLLGLSIIGLSSLVPSFIKEKRFSLEVSPRYSLLLSFGMIILVVAILLIGGFGTRLVIADMNFQKAMQTNDLEKRAKYLDQALDYRESYAPYRIAKARNHLRQARQVARENDPNDRQVAQFMAKAVNITKRATDSQPNSVKTWETLADMYLNSQRLVPGANDWAKKALKKAIELEPTNPQLHRKLAGVYVFAGNAEKARESYRKSVELKPDYVTAYIEYSQMLSQQGKYDEAIALYQPIFNLIEDSPRALFNLARLFYNRNDDGDLDRAEQILQQAVEQSDNYVNALYTLGLVNERQGDDQQAERYFDRVREIASGSEIEETEEEVENPEVNTR